jgi:hypothetical protein
MSHSRISGGGRIASPDFSEFGEIQNISEPAIASKVRTSLHEEEVALSLPPAGLPAREIAALDRILGMGLTVDNPVWSGDPVPRLRALQKKLVECSLLLETHERGDCLRSISLVERAVQLRLRWLQMQKSDAERDAFTVEGKRRDANEEKQ